MKKLHIIFAFLVFASFSTFAQRFVYVDTEFILQRIPEHQKAQEELNAISEKWRAEIEEKYKEIERLYKQYQAEQVLLTDDMKIQKQKEIEEKEKAAREFQKQKFGFEGDLFKKKQELIKPIQDKIYKEIQKLAEEKSYDFIFDRANGPSMLFATPKYDRSEDILKALGITSVPQPGAKAAPSTATPPSAQPAPAAPKPATNPSTAPPKPQPK